MTVYELIRQLTLYSPETVVFVREGESRLRDAALESTFMVLDEGTHDHEVVVLL